MLGTAITVSYSLATGFDRAAERGDLPDIVVRFSPEREGRVDARLRTLPNLRARSYRFEAKDIPIQGNFHERRRTAVEVVGPGRPGYAIVDGRDVGARRGEVVMERGLARAWDLSPGDQVAVGQLGTLRLVGIAVAPDDVSYPLISRPRVWVSRSGLALPSGSDAPVNSALIWVRDRSQLDATLAQARQLSYGLSDVRLATREGIRILVDRAAGIVIALLIGFSLVAAGAAGAMLAASARADVQRRLSSIGVQRAVGFSRGSVAAGCALESALIALPAAALGLTCGAVVASGPTDRLLDVLSELPPGLALVPPLLAALLLVVALIAAVTAWPAWRAASQPPATVMRGGELASVPARLPGAGGPMSLGVRLMAARRGRTGATVAVLGVGGAVVLLMLALASFLSRLSDDPGSVGRKYDLTAALPAERTAAVKRIPGVAAAAPRYADDGAASFDLGEPVKAIAFPGDHTRFEAPPLADGRRVRADDEAEVGLGVADALGLHPGGTLALQLASGTEQRFRVVGVVRSIENDGRVAYMRPRRLLAAEPWLEPTIAVKLDGEDARPAVESRLEQLGAAPRAAAGGTTRNAPFLDVLAGVLRVVALVNGLICLYVLVQALSLTAAERRPALSVLRAGGASRRVLLGVLAGAALAVTAPALPLVILLERLLLAPLVARLAAGYASLPLGAGLGHVLLVVAGLGLLAAGAALLSVRQLERSSIVAGLRGE